MQKNGFVWEVSMINLSDLTAKDKKAPDDQIFQEVRMLAMTSLKNV